MVLVGRLREAIRRLNPGIPEEAREEALAQGAAGRNAVADADEPELSHRCCATACRWNTSEPDGSIAGDHARLVDFDDVQRRTIGWSVNQFTVIEGQHNRRPDIVVFVNGLPLGVVELKNAADEDATIWTAFTPAADLQAGDRHVCCTTTKCWWCPMACKRASAR